MKPALAVLLAAEVVPEQRAAVRLRLRLRELFLVLARMPEQSRRVLQAALQPAQRVMVPQPTLVLELEAMSRAERAPERVQTRGSPQRLGRPAQQVVSRTDETASLQPVDRNADERRGEGESARSAHSLERARAVLTTGRCTGSRTTWTAEPCALNCLALEKTSRTSSTNPAESEWLERESSLMLSSQGG